MEYACVDGWVDWITCFLHTVYGDIFIYGVSEGRYCTELLSIYLYLSIDVRGQEVGWKYVLDIWTPYGVLGDITDSVVWITMHIWGLFHLLT